MRQRILDAAEEAFSTAAFHSVSVEAIASLARVGNGTIYRYFRDKSDLYAATLTRAVTRVVQEMEERASAGGTPEERLKRVLEALAAFFERNRGLLESVVRGEMEVGGEARRRLREQGQRVNALLRSVVEQGIREGRFRRVNPMLAAWVLQGACSSMIRAMDACNASEAVEGICDIVLSGLRSR